MEQNCEICHNRIATITTVRDRHVCILCPLEDDELEALTIDPEESRKALQSAMEKLRNLPPLRKKAGNW